MNDTASTHPEPLRFPVLPDAQMSARQREVAAAIASGPRGGLRGPFVALIHHPELAQPVQKLGEHLRYHAALPRTLVEFAILLTARHWQCQYEWLAHARIARNETDLPQGLIDEVAAGRTPAGMPADLAAVHAFCVDTLRRGQPGDAAYAEVLACVGRQGVLDLVALCGYYSLLAMVLNTARVPLPDGALPPLPDLPDLPDLPAPGDPSMSQGRAR